MTAQQMHADFGKMAANVELSIKGIHERATIEVNRDRQARKLPFNKVAICKLAALPSC
jgi:hypothetical protein